MMEKFETSLSGMEHKLLSKMSALGNNVSATLLNGEGCLESLEGQSLTHFLRVREFLVMQFKQTVFSHFLLSCETG